MYGIYVEKPEFAPPCIVEVNFFIYFEHSQVRRLLISCRLHGRSEAGEDAAPDAELFMHFTHY